jgi:prephenate dehydrogenase
VAEAAVRSAFENTAVIICNANESDADALEWINIYKRLGCICEMDAVAYDLHAAYVSHISHIHHLLQIQFGKRKEDDAILN